MEPVILDYEKNPKEFEKAIEAILSNLQTKISIVSSISGIMLAVILGAFLPLLMFLLVSPEHFINLLKDLLSFGYNTIISLIHLFQTNIIAGIIGSVIVLIIFAIPVLILKRWFRYVSSENFQTKTGEYTGLEALTEIIKEYDRYTKAKAYPKLWELHIILENDDIAQFDLKLKKNQQQKIQD